MKVLVWVCLGGLANRFCQGDNKAGRKFDDLPWLLATPERVERLANEGADAERAADQAAARRAQEVVASHEPADRARGEQARARLVALRNELAARQRGRG